MARTPVFNIVTAYETFESALRVKEMLDRLAAELRPTCNVFCEFWNFDLLAHESFRAQAGAEAAAANMIIIAACAETDLKDAVKCWCENWLPRKEPGHSALVALLDDEIEPGGELPRPYAYLQQVAARGNMAFFCQSGAGRPTELQYVVETVHREPEVPLALAARTGGSERGSWLGRKRLAGQRRAGHKLKETDMESPIQKHSKANGEQIARLAYGFWEQRGRPSGRDVELWLQAERQLANPNMPPATRIAPVRSSDAGAQARRPAEEKSAGWPSASAVKGAGRSSAKSTDSRDKARVFRAAAA